MTGSLGNSEFCFPRLRLGKHGDSRETKFTVPLGTSHFKLLYSYTFIQQNEHCDWLTLGHVPLIKFKCIPTGIQLGSLSRDVFEPRTLTGSLCSCF